MRRSRLYLAIVLAALPLASCTAQQVAAFQQVTAPTGNSMTSAQLEALRNCESSGNYAAVSKNGKFRGAYQFSRATWDGVASRHFPWLVGVDPAKAPFYWQDAMARALFAESGRRPWPHCGKRI